MVKSIRRKFVIVTVMLLIVSFLLITLTEANINRYWWDYDTVQFLEAAAETDYFLPDSKSGESPIIEGYGAQYNPVVGAVLDSKGNILYSKAAGVDRDAVDETLVSKMFRRGEKRCKVSSFVYTIKSLPEGNTLVIYMDTKEDAPGAKRLVTISALVILGILIMVIITAILSRFVTRPATAALNREKQFISDAGHELKTPLGSISINAQAAAMAHPEDSNISNVVSETARMARLVERMLTLSSLLEETVLRKHERINLSELAEEMMLTWESVAYEKGIAIIRDLEENLCISGDEDEIRQLMAILIDNAIEIPAKGAA